MTYILAILLMWLVPLIITHTILYFLSRLKDGPFDYTDLEIAFYVSLIPFANLIVLFNLVLFTSLYLIMLLFSRFTFSKFENYFNWILNDK